MICIRKGVFGVIRYHLNESLAYPTYQREPKSIYGMPSMHPLGKLICTQIHNSHKVKPKAHFSHIFFSFQNDLINKDINKKLFFFPCSMAMQFDKNGWIYSTLSPKARPNKGPRILKSLKENYLADSMSSQGLGLQEIMSSISFCFAEN